MKFFFQIYFRYLFARLFVPFAVCVFACGLIWVLVDIYGNLDEFVQSKSSVLLVLRFYALQLPSMLVEVLPAALLFSTLWTIMNLNRRSELVAFQSGGMAPIWLYSPFFAFAVIWMIVLAVDLNWPAPRALVTRERLLAQVKGQEGRRNVFTALPYVDRVNGRIWFFQTLDVNQAAAKQVYITQRNAEGHDMAMYFAREAKWTGDFWRLSDVKKIVYGVGGNLQQQQVYQELDLPDITTPTPKQLGVIVQQPDKLTVSQLWEFINASTGTPAYLAQYKTEWWYRILYPLSLLVFMFFGLLQGTRTDRRTAAAGVFWSLVVLIVYVMMMNVFLAAGRFNRLPPFIAVISTEVIFGGIGLGLLMWKNGWWWQLLEAGRKWKKQWEEDGVLEEGEEG